MSKPQQQKMYAGLDAIADAIGRKLDKSITNRTLQNWEKKYGFPIRRISDSIKARCFAYDYEINLWLDRFKPKQKVS